MTHVLTITKYDTINVTGWRNTVNHCGGGKIVKCKHGIEILVTHPARFMKMLTWLYN